MVAGVLDGSLAGLICFDCDENGVVYGVAGVSNARPRAVIVVLDVRQDLMAIHPDKSADQPAGITITDAVPQQVIRTVPAIDFNVRRVDLSRSGRYLALSGYKQEQDVEWSVVALVDLQSGQPDQAASSSSRVNDAASPSGWSHEPRCRLCKLHLVDPALFQNRAGLRLLQVSWHPHSAMHLAVLASDNRLRLYSALHPGSTAEQTLHLQPGTTSDHGSGRYGLSAMASASTISITAFAFGPPASWGMYTVLVLASTGAVYAVCPLAPFGMSTPSSVLQQLLASPHAALAATWLTAAFGAEAINGPTGGSRWPVLPHATEGAAPVLQGPLNADLESLIPISHGCRGVAEPAAAVALSVAHHVDYTVADAMTLADGSGMRLEPSVVMVVVTATMEGSLFAHALQGLLPPEWGEVAPQCLLAPSGEPEAVRYVCAALAASKHPQHTSSSYGSNLLLIDCIQLEKPPSVDNPAAFADSSDEDEDSDSIDGSSSCCRLRLLALSDVPQHVWVVHSRGCWHIDLQWLPALTQRGAGSGETAVQLPPPVVEELVSVKAGQARQLLGSCTVHGIFIGTGTLLLQAPGELHFFKPSPALHPLLTSDAPSTSDLSEGTQVLQGPLLPRHEQVDAHICRTYEELLAGPRRDLVLLQLPDDATPEAVAAHLHEAINLMRRKYIEYCHTAHTDIQARAAQLQSESQQHRLALGALQAQADEVAQCQATLRARMQRALALDTNLQERSGLLAMLLHNSLARPLSAAEQQFAKELTSAEQQHAALQAQLPVLRNRAAAVHKRLQLGVGPATQLATPPAAGALGSPVAVCAQSGVAVGPRILDTSSIPPAQLAKVHAAIMDQCHKLAQCSSKVSQVEEQLAAAKQRQLSARLAGLSAVP